MLGVSNGVYAVVMMPTKKPRVLKLLCVVSFEAIDSLQNAFLNETAISDGKRAVSEGKVCPLGIARGMGVGSVVALADPRMKLCREMMKQGISQPGLVGDGVRRGGVHRRASRQCCMDSDLKLYLIGD